MGDRNSCPTVQVSYSHPYLTKGIDECLVSFNASGMKKLIFTLWNSI